MAEEEGVDAIMLHARTRAQMYEGKANWDLIRELKEAVRIPVIGNGDVFEPADAFRMLEQTGCDGVMIGRGAMGNPWIFRGLLAWERGVRDTSWRPTPHELGAVIRQHFDRYEEWAGERSACIQMRKQLMWYTQGLPGVKEVRKRLPTLERRVDMEATLDAFLAGVSVADTRGTSGGARGASEGGCGGPAECESIAA